VKNSVLQYFFSPSMKPAAGSTTFSAFISTNDLSRAAIRYFRERGWKRLALISSTDASGQDGHNVVLENLQLPENKGITLVSDERFGIGDVSVAAQMSRIKAANAQALIAWTTGTPFGTVVHGVSDLGLNLPVMSSPANLIRAQILQYASFLPPQVYFVGGRFGSHDVVRPGPLRDAQDTFYRALKADKVEPESTHTFSWDPALIVIDALKHLGTGATAAQIHAYIEALHGFAGVNGLYDFRDGSQRGIGLSSAVIVQWSPAKSTFVAVSSGGGIPLEGH
jgi:branched-chain amino acid transport system substrate-binding protein